MAQFRGTLKGQRGEASRLGSKSSGLIVTANGWGAGVKVILSQPRDGQEDHIEILLTEGSNGSGKSVCLFYGGESKVRQIIKSATTRPA